MKPDQTIVAISSTVGQAARIVVRLSGPQSVPIVRSLASDLPPSPGAYRLPFSLSNLSFPAWIYTFLSPRSYTGEDLVELHLPGNQVLTRMVIDHCIARGARAAEAGEFTARAYFNGRLDLTTAEGVAATIHASNEDELQAARQLMVGELAKRLRPMMDRVAETLALVEVGIDFSDEEVTFLPIEEVRRRAQDVSRDLLTLSTESDRMERLSAEPTIVLVGRPNAGKSTLLNALAGHHRAVTSPVAGTTRDVLSADVPLKRGLVKLLDVAGLEELPADASDIDRAMQRRAREAVESADFVVLLYESGDPRPPLGVSRSPDLLVRTKVDLTPGPPGVLIVSALTGLGLDALRERLDTLAFGKSTGGTRLALNRRHLQGIDAAREALDRAAASASSHEGAEVIALDLREALDSLGSILGVISPDDVLGLVFSRFCIGK